MSEAAPLPTTSETACPSSLEARRCWRTAPVAVRRVGASKCRMQAVPPTPNAAPLPTTSEAVCRSTLEARRRWCTANAGVRRRIMASPCEMQAVPPTPEAAPSQTTSKTACWSTLEARRSWRNANVPASGVDKLAARYWLWNARWTRLVCTSMKVALLWFRAAQILVATFSVWWVSSWTDFHLEHGCIQSKEKLGTFRFDLRYTSTCILAAHFTTPYVSLGMPSHTFSDLFCWAFLAILISIFLPNNSLFGGLFQKNWGTVRFFVWLCAVESTLPVLNIAVCCDAAALIQIYGESSVCLVCVLNIAHF